MHDSEHSAEDSSSAALTVSPEAHWVKVQWQANANDHAGLGQVHVHRSGEAVHDCLPGHRPHGVQNAVCKACIAEAGPS